MKRNEISRLLPLVFQRTLKPASPLAAVLDVMDGRAFDTSIALLATIDEQLAA